MGKLKDKAIKAEDKALRAARKQAEEEAKVKRRIEQAGCLTKADLVALAKRRGYAQPEWWAEKVWHGRQAKR
jgi:hypothetical protein